MQSLRMMLMSGVATISLAVAPALAQQDTAPEATGGDQMAQGETPRSYDETYGGDFAAWGDSTVDELLGTEVVNDAGDSVGHIDNFALAGEELVAIIGVGGFLELGDHDVAIPIDEFETQGDQLLLSGMTREDLEALPQYNEGDAQAFASDQTLRSGFEGSETAAPTDTAMQEGDAESEEPMAEAGEEVAEAAEETGDAMGDAAGAVAETGEEMAESAEEATEPVTEGESSEMAEGESTEPMAEESEMAETDTAEEPAAGEGSEMADTADEPAAGEGSEMAEGEVTGESTTGESTEMAATEEESGWTEEMDQIFADIADREIAELIGMEVAGAEGDVVGEVDNFALEGEEVVAIVGVGGFLGIGEHDVALSLGEMTYDGERLVLSSMTEDQLREMPEYESNEENQLPQDGTLRSTYNQ